MAKRPPAPRLHHVLSVGMRLHPTCAVGAHGYRRLFDDIFIRELKSHIFTEFQPLELCKIVRNLATSHRLPDNEELWEAALLALGVPNRIFPARDSRTRFKQICFALSNPVSAFQNEDEVKWLYENGATEWKQPLIQAAKLGIVGVMRQAAQKGANENYSTSRDTFNKFIRRALKATAKGGHLQAVVWLDSEYAAVFRKEDWTEAMERARAHERVDVESFCLQVLQKIDGLHAP